MLEVIGVILLALWPVLWWGLLELYFNFKYGRLYEYTGRHSRCCSYICWPNHIADSNMTEVLLAHCIMALGFGLVVLYCYWLSGGFR